MRNWEWIKLKRLAYPKPLPWPWDQNHIPAGSTPPKSKAPTAHPQQQPLTQIYYETEQAVQFRNLTDANRKAVLCYTGDKTIYPTVTYGKINHSFFLKSKPVPTTVTRVIGDLKNSCTPSDSKLYLFRGTSLKYFTRQIGTMGGIYQSQSFWSCSLWPDISTQFVGKHKKQLLLAVYFSKNTLGRYVGVQSHYPDQYEMIIPPCVRYKVLSYKIVTATQSILFIETLPNRQINALPASPDDSRRDTTELDADFNGDEPFDRYNNEMFYLGNYSSLVALE